MILLDWHFVVRILRFLYPAVIHNVHQFIIMSMNALIFNQFEKNVHIIILFTVKFVQTSLLIMRSLISGLCCVWGIWSIVFAWWSRGMTSIPQSLFVRPRNFLATETSIFVLSLIRKKTWVSPICLKNNIINLLPKKKNKLFSFTTMIYMVSFCERAIDTKFKQ